MPTFGECTYRVGAVEGVASIETTGCDFNITAATTEGNPTGGEHAPVQIQCPEGAAHLDTRITAFKFLCRTVPPQLSADAVRFTNHETKGVKDIIGEATIHDGVSTTPGTGVCATQSGETEVHNTGTVIGSIKVTGYKDAAKTEPTGIWFE